jgi:hypothetical protein
MHTETHHTVVRVIQSDAIRRFGSRWDKEQPKLSPEQIYQAVSVITRAAEAEQEIGDENLRKSVAEPQQDKFAKSLEPLQKTFDFNAKQWATIGILIASTVFILLVFILFIILSL